MATLSLVAANDQSPAEGDTSRLSFATLSGTTYQIAVDGRNFASGMTALSHIFTPAAVPGDRFGVFLARHFADAELDDPTLTGYAADPDGDGLPNLLEYAFGLDPLLADADADTVPTAARIEGRLEFAYIRRTDAPDLAHVPEVSGTLNEWSSGDGAVEEIAVERAGENRERVTVRDAAAQPVGPRRFIRLRVELLEP